MRPPVAAVHGIVASLTHLDEREATHQRETLDWLQRTDDVFRRVSLSATETIGIDAGHTDVSI